MIDPQLQPFLADWARLWAELPQPATPAARRAHFERVAERMRQPTPAGVRADEQHRIAVEGTGRDVRVRVFRPAAAGPSAALIYMHGGAWMVGSPETHWDITAALAAASEMVVISVDYALAPEHPFPAAVDDAPRRRAVGLPRSRHARPAARRHRHRRRQRRRQPRRRDDAAVSRRARRTVARSCWSTPGWTPRSTGHRSADTDGPIVTVSSGRRPSTKPDTVPPGPAQPAAPLHCRRRPPGLPACVRGPRRADQLHDAGIAYADALRAAGGAVELDRAGRA